MLTCVTRPRRFDKSMAANMLCAYYDKSCDFGNDSNVVNSRDELFTLMVHLGYVSYNSADHTVSFPNLEVKMEFLG